MRQAETPALILASASAARRALLEAAGIVFTTRPAHIDEAGVKQSAQAQGSTVADAAMLLAELKAAAIAAQAPDAMVIGADQILVCDGVWFDKPVSLAEIRQHLKRISGVDISAVDGVGIGVAQTVIVECGTDLSQFPKEGNFCSWLGLAPKHEISGGKVLKNKTLKTKNRAGQAFRMAAQSVKNSDCVFGMMFRRFRARMDNRQATVATAHAIARVVYRMLKYKVEYESIDVTEYEKQYAERQVKYIKKKAAKLGFHLIPA